MMADIVEPDVPQPVAAEGIEIPRSRGFWMGIGAAGLIVFGLPVAAWIAERSNDNHGLSNSRMKLRRRRLKYGG
jgi:hypothetical protein